MDMGAVKIAVGLDLAILNDILVHLYEAAAIPPEINLGIGSGGDSQNVFHARLDQPVIDIKDPNTTPRAGVRLSGEAQLFNAEPVPMGAWIELIPVVVPVTDAAPQVGVSLGAIEDVTPAWLSGPLQTVLTDKLAPVLAGVTLPIYDSLIPQLATALDDPPAPDAWSCGVFVARPSTLERQYVEFPRGEPEHPFISRVEHRATVSSLLITLAMPGDDPSLPNDRSIVPRGSGLQILIAREAMDMILGAKTAAMVGQKIEGATIKSLTMKMHSLGIDIHGSAEKDSADITWDGVLLLYWRRWYYLKSGAMRNYPNGGFVDIFTSGIDVDVHLPWWVTLLEVFSFVLGPVGWILNSIFLAPKLEEAANAPSTVQGGLGDAVGSAFSDMLDSLSGITDIAPVPMKLYGRDAWVMDGHYAYTVLLMAGTHDAHLDQVVYDHFSVQGAEGQSVGYVILDTGHDLSPEEAGELMKDGILRIPGYHGVHAPYGYYFRSNPNETIADNLVEPADT